MWNLNMVDELENKLNFSLVTPNGSIIVDLSDSQKLWLVNPNILFQTGYRVAGAKEDIKRLLVKNNIASEEIDRVVETSITINNCRGIYKQMYESELKKLNSIKCNYEQRPAAIINNPPPVKSRGRAIQPLHLRLERLPQDKYLDVSNLTSNGGGAHVISLGPRVKKYHGKSLRMVSNNLETYLLAIDMLGGAELYKDDVDRMKQLFASLNATQGHRPPPMPVTNKLSLKSHIKPHSSSVNPSISRTYYLNEQSESDEYSEDSDQSFEANDVDVNEQYNNSEINKQITNLQEGNLQNNNLQSNPEQKIVTPQNKLPQNKLPPLVNPHLNIRPKGQALPLL
jgi:hypothetical protein